MQSLINTIGNFGQAFMNFLSSLGSAISWIVSVIKTIGFGLSSLLTKLWSLIQELMSGDVFINMGKALDLISGYIGGPATVFLASLFFLVLVRIVIAFVFKIIRLNINYRSDYSKTTRYSLEDSKKGFFF